MSPTSRSAPDACPGALQVHDAADGGLARIRLPGGVLRAHQLAALTGAAAELGDGHLELTSRGNLQLRALRAGATAELGARLRDAGLLPSDTHEKVRNITASVLSGRDGPGLMDVRPLATGLDAALCADPAMARLPGRFLFTIDDGRGDVIAARGDVGLYAVDGGTLALVLGGADSGLRVGPSEAVALAMAAARAFLDARTTEWRLSELDGAIDAITARLPGTRVAPVPVPRTPRRPPLGEIPQHDGRFALSGLVPLGRLDPESLAALSALEEIIITPWRGVVIPDLTAVPGSHGLVVEPGSGWEGLSTCAGRPGCAKSLTDVRADASRARRAVDGLPVHWAGCERRCGHPADRHVAVVATADGYDVRIGERVHSRSHDLTATATAVAATRRNA